MNIYRVTQNTHIYILMNFLLFHTYINRAKHMLGAGQFAEVFRGEWVTPQGTQEVAIKVLREGHAKNDKVKFLQEAAIMAQFRHPHIVRLLGAVTVDEPVRGCGYGCGE